MPKLPDFPGVETFTGETYFAPRWPKHAVDLSGKRVAIIGAAATAVQILPIVAHTAAHVGFFQRTPNYVLPGRNYTIDRHEDQAIKAQYDAIRDQTRSHAFGLPMVHSGRTYDSVSDEERQRVFEAGWEAGGFHFCFETFDDILTDMRSNDAASEFVRNKIRAIVKDPQVAEKLCPRYPIFSKRPPSGHFFYEAFNRPNVELVDIAEDPIIEVTAKGIRTGSREHEYDVIIFAIGFDAVTGPLMAIDLRGRGGVTIQSKWAEGPRTHLGIMVDEFPNLFMIMGPQSPFGNIPTIIEAAVDWVGAALDWAQERGIAQSEPRREAAEAWSRYLKAIYDMTMLSSGIEARAWFLGANIEGKAVAPLLHFGGVSTYIGDLRKEIESGFAGLLTEDGSRREASLDATEPA